MLTVCLRIRSIMRLTCIYVSPLPEWLNIQVYHDCCFWFVLLKEEPGRATKTGRKGGVIKLTEPSEMVAKLCRKQEEANKRRNMLS